MTDLRTHVDRCQQAHRSPTHHSHTDRRGTIVDAPRGTGQVPNA